MWPRETEIRRMSKDTSPKKGPKEGSKKSGAAKRAAPAGRSPLQRGAQVGGLVVLSFLLGAMVVQFKMFPYPQFLEGAFMALASTVVRVKVESWTVSEIAFNDEPVTTHVPEKTYDGYTFYTSAHSSSAYLVDMNGHKIHEWHAPFSKVWPKPPHVVESVKDVDVFWRRAHLFSNGDVVAMFETPTLSPWGMGVVKVDKDSNVLWSFAERAHNDISVDSGGNVYAITHEFRDTRDAPVSDNPQLPSTVLDDFVVKLSPQGEELQRVSLLGAITKSDFRHILNIFPDGDEFVTAPWDPLHTNSVKVIEPAFAQHHSWAKPGDVIVSMRAFDALAAIDMSESDLGVVWANRGFWMGQHDADLLENGNVMLFDNLGHSGAVGRRSRVLEFDPTTNAIKWVYPPNDEKRFFSSTRSSQQLLPNGNVLITASDAGFAFEVTRDGEAVWVFMNPAEVIEGEERGQAGLLGATRFPQHYVTFALQQPSSASK